MEVAVAQDLSAQKNAELKAGRAEVLGNFALRFLEVPVHLSHRNSTGFG
jgi:hypothetical protein